MRQPDRRFSLPFQPGSFFIMLLLAIPGSAMLQSRALAAPSSPTANLTLSEHEIKAAALYNIIAFTNWPDNAFARPDSPLVIGIIGQGPIASFIVDLVQNETWHGRKVVVEHFDDSQAIKACQVLYVAKSERPNWDRIRTECLHRPVLAISDGDNFAAQGGNVQLSIEQNKLRILVNLAATRANGLQLSSNLLHLAKIVGPMPDSMEAPQGKSRLGPVKETTRLFAATP